MPFKPQTNKRIGCQAALRPQVQRTLILASENLNGQILSGGGDGEFAVFDAFGGN